MAAPTNWLAEAAAQHRAEHGPGTPGSMNRALNVACPKCTTETRLIQYPGQQKIACEGGGHEWKDIPHDDPMQSVTALEQIKALNPKPLANQPRPKEAVQANREPITFQIHKDLKAALAEKFGVKLDATLAAMCALLMDMNAFVVDAENSKRIKALFPDQNIRDGSSLYGLLFAQSREILGYKERDAERERQRILKGEAAPASSDDIVLRLPSDIRSELMRRAGDHGKDVEKYLVDQFKFFLDNGWL